MYFNARNRSLEIKIKFVSKKEKIYFAELHTFKTFNKIGNFFNLSKFDKKNLLKLQKRSVNLSTISLSFQLTNLSFQVFFSEIEQLLVSCIIIFIYN